jgi:hypothetical protein
MHRTLKGLRAAALTLGSLAVVGLVVNPGISLGDGPKPTQPVIVTNTPLPVSAAQSGSWGVSVVNTPTVNIGSLPDVTINTAGPLPVRDVDNPARHAFQTGADGFLAPGPDTQELYVAGAPAGKIFVIEYVSGTVGLPAGNKILWLGLQTDQGAGPQDHMLAPPTFAGSSGGVDSYGYGQLTRLYCTEAGLRFFIHRTGTDLGSVSVYLSGYLVDAAQ